MNFKKKYVLMMCACCLVLPQNNLFAKPGNAVFSNRNNVSENYQSKTIRGRVVDKNGEPVIGASLSVKGQTKGTVTDLDGNFT